MHLVLTDLHGMRRQTDRALQAISAAIGVDWQQCRLVVLGDCVDYGRESREVLQLLSAVVNPILIAGNHEAVLLTALKKGEPTAITGWLISFGGYSTLRSYRMAGRVSIAGDYTHMDGRPIRTQQDIRWFLTECAVSAAFAVPRKRPPGEAPAWVRLP